MKRTIKHILSYAGLFSFLASLVYIAEIKQI